MALNKQILALSIISTIALSACSSQSSNTNPMENTLKLRSTAFINESQIPSKYTCDKEGTAPDLAWDSGPEGTSSYALIVDDPDAPSKTWVHWVAFNIPATITFIPEGASASQLEGVDGVNSWGNTGYGGPCPPSGIHRYYFKIYALDTMLKLDSSATKKDVLNTIEGHILSEGVLMGTYQRQ